MKKQSLALTLSLCLGLTAFTACTPGTTPVSQQSVAKPAQTMSLQAALATYHEVDASFSDTQRLAQAGKFQTKLLGLGEHDDDDNDGGLLGNILDGSSNG